MLLHQVPASGLIFRDEPTPSDAGAVQAIVESTGFFSKDEVAVAVELVGERLARGVDCGYLFLFAERAGEVIGYTCFGLIPCTVASFDLYWIAVHEAHRGQGVGRELLTRSEQAMAAHGAARIYIETSSRAQYHPTRAFYLRCGYREEARLVDYYAPGDSKIIFVRSIEPASTGCHVTDK